MHHAYRSRKSARSVGILTLAAAMCVITAATGAATPGRTSDSVQPSQSLDRADQDVADEELVWESFAPVDESDFPTDLDVGESKTVVDGDETTTYQAISASCTVSMTISTPYLWSSNNYVRANFSVSVGSGCVGNHVADIRLWRRQVTGLWTQEAYTSNTFSIGMTWSGNVRKKCRNNSLNVAWRARAYWNNGMIQSQQATLACRL